MATLSTILSFARAQAQTDNNGLTDTKGIIFANEALLDFHGKMIAHGIDASQTQEAYTSSTANQGTYLYPTDMWFLKAIEVTFDGTNYLTASQIDVSNLPGGSFSFVRANQNPQFPLFDDRGDQFELFPTPKVTVTNMFRIFYFLEPTEYTSTSDTISYPVSLDYRILGWRIAASYLRSLRDFDGALDANGEYEKKVDKLVKTLGRGTQQPMQATPIQTAGWEF